MTAGSDLDMGELMQRVADGTDYDCNLNLTCVLGHTLLQRHHMEPQVTPFTGQKSLGFYVSLVGRVVGGEEASSAPCQLQNVVIQLPKSRNWLRACQISRTQTSRGSTAAN